MRWALLIISKYVKKPQTTAKKTVANTVEHTAKKTAAKTKKIVTATKKNGLSDTDVLWAQEKANEYLQTLKGVTLDTTASGYTLSSGISIIKTKEELIKRLKSAIDCDYESALEADWHDIHMYLKWKKTNKATGFIQL